MVKHRWLYPANWEDLAWQCKERAGWYCEFCGIAQGTEVVSERTGVVYEVRLAAAHLDHDPWNPEPRLAALCPSCHGRYDSSWQERQRWLELEELRHRLWVQAHGYGMEGSGRMASCEGWLDYGSGRYKLMGRAGQDDRYLHAGEWIEVWQGQYWQAIELQADSWGRWYFVDAQGMMVSVQLGMAARRCDGPGGEADGWRDARV